MRMNYREEKALTKKNKEDYLLSFEELIEKKQKEAFKVRKEYAKGIFEAPEKYRDDLKEMLGWSLVDYEGKAYLKHRQKSFLTRTNILYGVCSLRF